MKMKLWRIFTLAMPLAILIMIAGCSFDPATAPYQDQSAGTNPDSYLSFTAGEPVQFFAKVATSDRNSLMLTFYGCSDTVIAFHNCEIVRLKNDMETPVPFSDIQHGDSLHVNGQRQQNGYVYAHKIQICCDSACTYDVAFRDTIISIDYLEGFFTVAQHIQTIYVDSNTEIWTVVNYDGNKPDDTANTAIPHGGTAKMTPEEGNITQRVSLSFTDLQVGSVVEVRANIVDATTLLAVKIKLADCNNYREYVDFEATISNVDLELNLVTFESLNWIGRVCKGTRLIDVDGELIPLDAFASGDYVYVKGFPEEADSLKICEMKKL